MNEFGEKCLRQTSVVQNVFDLDYVGFGGRHLNFEQTKFKLEILNVK
jgi:hypothetical protein